METTISVVVATTSQSLATFIKQELAGTNTTVHLLTDPDLFFKQLKAKKPELILLDANYPTGEKSAGLAKTLQQELAWQNVPLQVIKTFFEPLDESFPEIDPENTLTQPFTRSDLLTVLQRVVPQAITNHKQDQDMPMKEEIEKADVVKVAASRQGTIIELTDMVEEGLPLDQLPPAETETGERTGLTVEPAIEIPTDSQVEDPDFLSDEAIDGLEFTPTETMEVQNEEAPQEDKQLTGQSTNIGESKSPPEENLDFSETTAVENPAEETAATADIEVEEPEALAEAFTTESPDDYIVPDEDELMETTESRDLPPPPAESMAEERETARPSVVTEPQTADFSHQIEGLTQEWSKKMLVSTYASMDKLIQALGDMAPTIVEQVAREIIPPLAEKIIKSEIKRLEEKIEDDHT